jgi:hypothetical protein
MFGTDEPILPEVEEWLPEIAELLLELEEPLPEMEEWLRERGEWPEPLPDVDKLGQGEPLPVYVERLVAELRATADAIQAEIGSLSNRDNGSALASVGRQADRAAEIAAMIARVANDPELGWKDVWRDGKYDSESEQLVWAPPSHAFCYFCAG